MVKDELVSVIKKKRFTYMKIAVNLVSFQAARKTGYR